MPDLVIADLKLSGSPKAAGGIGVELTIENKSSTAAEAFDIEIYFSTDQYFSSNAKLHTTVPITSLAANASTTWGASLVLPDWVTSSSQDYYVLAWVNRDQSVTESNYDNDSLSKVFELDTVAPVEPQSTLPVAVGGAATISTAFLLSYDDVSGPDAVTYRIAQAPTHGTLLLDGLETRTFTQADIDGGRVQYSQTGGAATSDGFTFTVSDAAGNTIGPEPFTIAIVDTTEPVGVGTDLGTCSIGGGLPIWKDALCTVALGSDPAEMVYTVVSAPAHGALILDGQPASSFTQADIDNHHLNYVQPGGSPDSDSFSYVVTDSTGKETAPRTFDILIQDATAPATAINDPVGAAAPDSIITDPSWNAPADTADIDTQTASNDLVTFGFADLAAPSADPDLFAGWSDGADAGSGDAMLAAYLELEPRWDDAGDSGGGW